MSLNKASSYWFNLKESERLLITFAGVLVIGVMLYSFVFKSAVEKIELSESRYQLSKEQFIWLNNQVKIIEDLKGGVSISRRNGVFSKMKMLADKNELYITMSRDDNVILIEVNPTTPQHFFKWIYEVEAMGIVFSSVDIKQKKLGSVGGNFSISL